MPLAGGKYKYVMLVGLPGSGKDVAARILEKELGYAVVVMSDMVERESAKRGLGPTRENFRKVGKELREEFGPAAIAILSMREIETFERLDKRVGYVINGIRNIEEIDAIKREFGDEAASITIHAHKRTRYRRLRERTRKGFDLERRMSYEEFLKQDRSELELFEMGNALIWADWFVLNEGTVENLKKEILSIVLVERGA